MVSIYQSRAQVVQTPRVVQKQERILQYKLSSGLQSHINLQTLTLDGLEVCK